MLSIYSCGAIERLRREREREEREREILPARASERGGGREEGKKGEREGATH